jgi:2-polyprenyl-6-hydroxyphenyl methylase / 3-demethylubiquinone-9 3-methyltransferase
MTGVAGAGDDTADAAELAKFAGLGREWWDTTGPMAPLHKLNPVRVAYIRDRACERFRREPKDPRPLAGLRVLDVGCGGGLLAEPLARLGGTVTAIDPLPANIDAARWHADEAGVEVDYRAVGVEAMATGGPGFDLAVASEVVEHVADVLRFLEAVAAVTRPGGLVVLSTLSRTLVSFVEAVVGAEYLLGWLPRGTHDWRRFLTPAELGGALRRCGMRPFHVSGVGYDGARDRFELRRNPSVNYLLAAARG